jgi:hypothetical protein
VLSSVKYSFVSDASSEYKIPEPTVDNANTPGFIKEPKSVIYFSLRNKSFIKVSQREINLSKFLSGKVFLSEKFKSEV